MGFQLGPIWFWLEFSFADRKLVPLLLGEHFIQYKITEKSLFGREWYIE